MPEAENNYYRVPNPNYNGASFKDGTYRTAPISASSGIFAIWGALQSSGKYKAVTLLFDKSKWNSLQECENWVTDHKREFKGYGIADKCIEAFEATPVTRRTGTMPTEAELRLINEQYSLEPLEADNVYVREMLLTNDQWTKHNRRLARSFQKSIIESMPGKSLLLGHPEAYGAPAIPEGRFFAAEEWRDDNGTNWNRCKFYIVKTPQNEHLRAQIDGGILSHTSVGMETDELQCSICGNNIYDYKACNHIPGAKYEVNEDKKRELKPQPVEDEPGMYYCGVIYRGKGTAVEGSIVYWPEANDTKVLSAFMAYNAIGDYGRAKEALLGGDSPDDTGLPVTAAEQSGEVITADTDIKGDETPMTEAEIKALEASKNEALDKVAALEADAAKAAETLAAKAAEADKLRSVRVQEIEKLAAILKRDAELAAFKAAFGETLDTMPIDNLLTLEAEWAKQITETLPGGRQSTDSTTEEEKPADTERESFTVRKLSGI